jgi:hypothetical protein
MTFRENGQDGLAVIEQAGRWMPKILPGFLIDQNLTVVVVGQIDERDFVSPGG